MSDSKESQILPPIPTSPSERKNKEKNVVSLATSSMNEQLLNSKILQEEIELPKIVQNMTTATITTTTNTGGMQDVSLKDNDTSSNDKKKVIAKEASGKTSSKTKHVEVVKTNVTKKGNSEVFIRIRPIVRDGGGHDQDGSRVAKVLDGWDEKSVTINTAYLFSEGSTIYKFPEKVLGPEADQETVFNAILPTYISSFTSIDGHNVVLIAYGQTGTGKTHTMFGTDESLKISNISSIHKDWGILPRTVASTFEICNSQSAFSFILTASAVEFYLGQCYDLLNNHTILEIDTATAQPLGMEFIQIENLNDLFQYINIVKQMRTSCTTRMNQASDEHEGSSRSHCALILRLYSYVKDTKNVYQSTFTVFDLAGAERPNKVGVKERQSKQNKPSGPSSFTSTNASSSSSSTEITDSGALMGVWRIEGERQKGSIDLAMQVRRQANQPEYLALQAQVINYELHELRSQVYLASEQHKKKKSYTPPTAACYLGSTLCGSYRTGMIVTLSQAPQNGWETWFSLTYGTTLAELEVRLKKRKTNGKLDKLMNEVEKEKETKAQAIAVEPAMDHPSRKFYGKKVAAFKETEVFLRILNLLKE